MQRVTKRNASLKASMAIKENSKAGSRPTKVRMLVVYVYDTNAISMLYFRRKISIQRIFRLPHQMVQNVTPVPQGAPLQTQRERPLPISQM